MLLLAKDTNLALSGLNIELLVVVCFGIKAGFQATVPASLLESKVVDFPSPKTSMKSQEVFKCQTKLFAWVGNEKRFAR